MLPFNDPLFFVAFIVILVLYWFFVQPSEPEDYLLFMFTAALSFIIAIVSNIVISLAAFMTVACINNLFRRYFYLYLATLFVILAAASYLYFAVLQYLVLAVSVAGIIGLTFSRNLRESLISNEQAKGKDQEIEGKRDLFQIVSGLMLIIIALFSGRYFFLIVMIVTFVLLGIGNLAATGHSTRVRSFFYGMERQSAILGTGAIMIASGTLFMISLIRVQAIILTSIFVVLIGDSLSSLVGMHYPIAKLPFNKKKSLGGFLAMLVTSMLFAFVVSGFSLALPLVFAVLGSIVEAATFTPLDDNITVPFSLVLVYLLIP